MKARFPRFLRHSRFGIPGEPGVDNGDIFYSLRIAKVRPVDLHAEASNPQRDMLEHPIFALPHNRIHPYSDDALAALGRTPTLEAGRKSADRPAMGARDQIRRLSDGRPHRTRQRSTPHSVRLDLTAKYPATAAAFAKLPVKTAYIDGELCGVRADGVTSFELMQQASDAGYGGLVYFAFDLLDLDGENVARLPLLERKERLAQLLKDPPAGVVYSEHEGGDGEAFRRAACRHGLEGVVSKRTDRPYSREIGARGSRASASTAPSSSSSDGPTRKGHATSLVRSCWATTIPKAD